MVEKPVPEEPEYVACQVCLEEIPLSVAISHEADQYTQHFCGLDCYSLWKAQRQIDPNNE